MTGKIYMNPFREFRAEQMGDDLWRLYVPWPSQNLLAPRPLIIEGGRGCGKTMFFLCNSWKERLNILKSEGKSIKDLISHPEFIGIYYKVDTAFVTSMTSSNQQDWDGIFSTYIGITLAKEIFKFVKTLIIEGIVTESLLKDFYTQFNYVIDDEAEIENIDDALKISERILDNIEIYLNSPDSDLRIKRTLIGRLINKLVTSLREIECLKDLTFRIFIDEYESLLENQQKLINTLIKHSNSYLIYNIGMRPKGMRTPRTSGAGNEIIQAPHDFTHFRPEIFFDPEGKNESRMPYNNLLKDICKLRLNKFKESMGFTSIPDDIEYYLGEYNLDNELEDIIKDKKNPFLERLIKKIKEESPEDTEKYIQELVINAPPLNARLHLCLLLRSAQYKPSLEILLEEYNKWKSGESKKYSDWLHNTKHGLIFLLSKEYDHQKQYYGFDVFTLLSTGVVRYFLELCEQAFDFAMMNGFNWNAPQMIVPADQTRAARYVSRYKIKDIEGYEPFGKTMTIFVHQLGETFKELHRNKDLTLGEPEPNHFAIDNLSIDEQTKKKLDSAVMWGVLQERISTKEKEVSLPIETIDFHLNRIYCPYFEISYRKKRKIFLSDAQIRSFLSGDEKEAKSAAKNFLDERLGSEKKISNDQIVGQMSFFSEDDLND